MASDLITSWQIDGENSGNSDRLYFPDLQNHFRLENKKCLLLGRKAMTNLDSVLESRGTTLLTKVCVVKVMIFLYSCMDVKFGS